MQLELIRADAPPSARAALKPTLDTAEVCGLTLRETLDDVLEIQRLGAVRHLPMPLTEIDLARSLRTFCQVALNRHHRRSAHQVDHFVASVTDLPTGSASPSSDQPNLVVEIEARPSWTASISAPALRRITLSVLDNACKFCAPPGLIRVRMSLVDVVAESGAAMLQLIVEDHGIGMDESFAKTGMWKPFVRASASFGGAGLGLPISLSLAKRLGGTIDVRSTIHLGTSASLPERP